MKGLRSAVAVAVLAGTVLACADDEASKPTTVRVFAASSLRDAFADIEATYEQKHPDVDVEMVFAGSQVLRLQIEHGADVGVFASAHLDHLTALHRQGRMAPPVPFAKNQLAILVPTTSTWTSLADLASVRRMVVGDPASPIGRYTDDLWRRARKAVGDDLVNHLLSTIVSRESNVRLLRAKVELGAVDAAVCYRTDALSSTKVRALPLPDGAAVDVTYHVAPVADGGLAPDAFVRFLRGADGQAVLQRHGFAPGVP